VRWTESSFPDGARRSILYIKLAAVAVRRKTGRTPAHLVATSAQVEAVCRPDPHNMKPAVMLAAAAIALVVAVSAAQSVVERRVKPPHPPCVVTGQPCTPHKSKCCDLGATCKENGKYLWTCQGTSYHTTTTTTTPTTTTTTKTTTTTTKTTTTTTPPCVKSGQKCTHDSKCCEHGERCKKTGIHGKRVCKGDYHTTTTTTTTPTTTTPPCVKSGKKCDGHSTCCKRGEACQKDWKHGYYSRICKPVVTHP
jgi:hypothetical protein